jgi:perosamine synthetase
MASDDFATLLGTPLAINGGVPVRSAPIDPRVHVSESARQRVLHLLDCGKLSDYYGGDWSHQLEDAFARYHGHGRRAVAVNSGTTALHLALSAAGVGPGDEVIVPALCFVAAALAVVQNGAVPVICDAEPAHLTLDVRHAEALISRRTKAILPVHFWGYPSDAAALRTLSDQRGLLLIEDCAQALGAAVGERRVGAFGDYATFAFSVRKHVASGEGGLVLCAESSMQARLRSLSNYGKGPGWDDYLSAGFSYRLAEFPSIVAIDGLERLHDETAARRLAADCYRELFEGTGLSVVPEPSWGCSVYFKCPVLLPDRLLPFRREIVKAISAENVSCRVPHRPLFSIPWLQEYLRDKRPESRSQCPVAADNHSRLIEIETGPQLPLDEARRSAAAVLKVYRHFEELADAQS